MNIKKYIVYKCYKCVDNIDSVMLQAPTHQLSLPKVRFQNLTQYAGNKSVFDMRHAQQEAFMHM